MSRRTKAFIIAAISALILLFMVITATVAVLMVKSMNKDDAIANRPIVAESPYKVVTIAPPSQVPSAQVVASRVNCTRFRNIAVGGGVKGIVLDGGNCYIGGVKYAIDTFQTPASRDLWLKMSEPYGVVPKFETSTSVVYKSVDG